MFFNLLLNRNFNPKCSWRVLFFSILFPFLSACQGNYFKTEDVPPSKKSPDVHLECIDGATEVMAAFFRAEAPADEKISASWDCYGTALGSFSRYFAGQANPSEFTTDEFRDLVNNYFRENKPKIRREMIVELLKIKQLLLGGTRNSITRTELGLFHSKIGKLKQIMLKLNPHMSILMNKPPRGEVNFKINTILSELNPFKSKQIDTYSEEAKFQSARIVLMDEARELAKLFLENQPDYCFVDFANLINEINIFAGSEEKQFQKVQKYFSSIKGVKSAIMGGAIDGIASSEWRILLPTLADSYTQFLWYKGFIQNQNYSSIERIDFQLKAIEMAGQAIDNLLQTKAAGPFITQQEIVDLIQVLGTQFDLLPTQVTSKSLEQVIDVFLKNVLMKPQARISNTSVAGHFDSDTLSELVALTRIWLESERLVLKYFEGPQFSNPFGLGEVEAGRDIRLSSKLIIQNLTSQLEKPDSLSEAQRTYYSEMIRILNSPIDMVVDSQGRLLISTQKSFDYDRSSFRIRNRDYLIAHVIQNSASKSLKRIERYEGISESEGEEIYQKLFPFLMEMGWMTPLDNEFFKKRFKEANLFGPRSDGNDFASFQEIADISAMLFSGIKNSSMLGSFVKKDCLFKRGFDESVQVVDQDCLLNVYHQNLTNVVFGLPELVDYTHKASASDIERYFLGLLSSASPENMMQIKKISLRDAALIPHIIQYIEMIFAKYDIDHNGIIDNPEARRAFPNFRQLLRKIPELDSSIGPGRLFSENDVLPIFLYLMSEQKIPKGFSEKGYFYYWVKFKSIDSMTFSDSRTQISSIMGIIAKEIQRGK